MRTLILGTTLVVAILWVAMLLPYLPGRFDASAAAVSFLVRVAGHASLILAPVGLVWSIHPRLSRRWLTVALVLAALIAATTALAALAINQLALGVVVGLSAASFLWRLRRRMRVDFAGLAGSQMRISLCLLTIPLLLLAFQATVLPRAASWSRDRAIQRSTALIAEIESFRQRRGHYPISLRSLNRDVPTGIVGIERFHYEPSGEAYHVFFVRPSLELDAAEVVIFNPRNEPRFTSHELDLLQYDGDQLDRRRGDQRRTQLGQPHWVSILFD